MVSIFSHVWTHVVWDVVWEVSFAFPMGVAFRRGLVKK